MKLAPSESVVWVRLHGLTKEGTRLIITGDAFGRTTGFWTHYG